MVLGKFSSQQCMYIPEKNWSNLLFLVHAGDLDNDEVGDDGQGTQISKKELISMVLYGADAVFNATNESALDEVKHSIEPTLHAFRI
jgi:hypothetical protein